MSQYTFSPMHYEAGIEIRFAGNNFLVKDIFAVLAAQAQQFCLPPLVKEQNSDAQFSLDYLAKSFESDVGLDYFSWGDHLLIVSGGIAKAQFTRLCMYGPKRLLKQADAWIGSFANSLLFLQAYAFDGLFDSLQSATHPVSYRVAKKNMDGVVVRNLGLPRPFHEECEIDTSFNPGRRPVHRTDTLVWSELISAQMWFAESFWPLAGKTKSSFSLDPKLGKVEDVGHGVLKITARDTPFDSDDQREHMDALRKAIYGVDPPMLPPELQKRDWLGSAKASVKRLFSDRKPADS